MKTTVIIGGGASGMMAAMTAARESDNHILLLERQARVGRKLLSSGNGRCNLSNLYADRTSYHGADTDFVLPALKRFGVGETLDFFRGLGLITVTEPDGRVYPLSNHANSVVDVLRFGLQRDNIELHTENGAVYSRRNGSRFLVGTTEGGHIHADYVIVACGGAAAPKLGGVMDGYRLLEEMGHSRTKLNPSLVQVKTDPTYPRALKGVKADAVVAVFAGPSILAAKRGEVLFTEYGVSGPAVFDISRAISTGGDGLSVHLDLLADLTEDEVMTFLVRRREIAPHLPANQMLTGALHNRLGQMVCKYGRITSSQRIGQLSNDELRAVAGAAKEFVLEVEGVAGFDSAQVTAGGINTDEFNPDTLESRLIPGLFACGEVLDIDGDCGGFNLQWAWSSGHLAGRLGK
ncbi:MAG: NAD(P)/FAD-dependent oxidoreductase [Syntrophomonadaceae bacterium]|nr:NAD(P)/FAD-dependent oxidoreductase [Syntrophomonadaceae bacterium]